MPKVFICYRREDSAYPAHQIYTILTNHFGSQSVVFDVDTIPLGIDFRKYLNKQVSRCDILIAVIGDKWMEILKQGLDKPNDFVRIEIQAALKREIPVVPVLVGKAAMPDEENLPPELAGLAYMQAAEVRAGPDLKVHLERLINGLEYLLAELKAEEEAKEEERKRKEAEEAKRIAEEERKRKEAEEAKRIAEEERRQKEAEAAKRKAEEELRQKEAQEAKRKAEEERRQEEEQKAKRKAEEEHKQKQAKEAKRKAEEERKQKEAEAAKRKAEEAKHRKEQEDQERKAEEDMKREEAAAILSAREERIKEKPQFPIQPSPDVIQKPGLALRIGLAVAAVFLVICMIAGGFYVQLLTSALRQTSTIFMMGVGLMLVLRINRIVNFAHGVFYVLGGYVSYWAAASLGQSTIGYILIAILAGLLVGGLGILIETILLRRIYQLPVINQILACAGIFFALIHLIMAVFRPDPLISGPDTGSIEILGIFIGTYNLFVIALGLMVLAGLYFLLQRTEWMGRQYSEETEHKDNASPDINRRRFRTAVFFIATALAGFAGAVTLPITGIYPSAGFDVLAAGFLVTLLAGLASPLAAYLAAFMIGSFQAFGSAFWGQGAPPVIIFVVIAIFLTWRPGGLFSQTDPEPQDTVQPEPPDRPDRRLLITAGAIAIVLLSVPAIGATYFTHLMPAFFGHVLLGASLYFLMRTEGFISLGQSTFVAISGYGAAMLTVQLGIPIVVALPLGVIAAGLIGFLIALPCARLSPTSIAMLTFVLAYTIFELLNFSFTDGIFVPVSLEPSQSYYISLFLCIMGLALILYAPFSRIYARQQDKTGQRSQLRSGSSRTLGVRCLSFAIAGSIAGLSGCIHAIHWQLISPSHASIHESLTTLSVFAIGGIHSAFGPVLGAVAVVGLREFLVSFPNIWQIAIGAAVIVIIMYYPKGLSGIFETFFGGKHPTVDRKK